MRSCMLACTCLVHLCQRLESSPVVLTCFLRWLLRKMGGGLLSLELCELDMGIMPWDACILSTTWPSKRRSAQRCCHFNFNRYLANWCITMDNVHSSNFTTTVDTLGWPCSQECLHSFQRMMKVYWSCTHWFSRHRLWIQGKHNPFFQHILTVTEIMGTLALLINTVTDNSSMLSAMGAWILSMKD